MARAVRIEFPGAFYHVIARGNERKAIFRNDSDYILFLDILGQASRTFGFSLHAYALMPNHYHLLLEAPRGLLSRGMQFINASYSQTFNRQHDRVGHLFQGRFKAFLVEKDSYLLALSRYIHQNPSKAGLVARPWLYPWSSCRQVLGLEETYAWLVTSETLSRFGSRPDEQRRAFARFLLGPWENDPAEEAVGQLLLGSKSFLAQAGQRARAIAAGDSEFGPRTGLRELPQAEALLGAASRITGENLRGPFERSRNQVFRRSLALYVLRKIGGLPLKEAALKCSLTSSAASHAIGTFASRLDSDAGLRLRVENLTNELRRDIFNFQDVTP